MGSIDTSAKVSFLSLNKLCTNESHNSGFDGKVSVVSNDENSLISIEVPDSKCASVGRERVRAIQICGADNVSDHLAGGELHAKALAAIKDEALEMLLGPSGKRDADMNDAAERIWNGWGARPVLVAAFHYLKYEVNVGPKDPVWSGLITLIKLAKNGKVLADGTLGSSGNSQQTEALKLIGALTNTLNKRVQASYGSLREFVEFVAETQVSHLVHAQACRLGHLTAFEKFTPEMLRKVLAQDSFERTKAGILASLGNAGGKPNLGKALIELHKMPDYVIDRVDGAERPDLPPSSAPPSSPPRIPSSDPVSDAARLLQVIPTPNITVYGSTAYGGKNVIKNSGNSHTEKGERSKNPDLSINKGNPGQDNDNGNDVVDGPLQEALDHSSRHADTADSTIKQPAVPWHELPSVQVATSVDLPQLQWATDGHPNGGPANGNASRRALFADSELSIGWGYNALPRGNGETHMESVGKISPPVEHQWPLIRDPLPPTPVVVSEVIEHPQPQNAKAINEATEGPTTNGYTGKRWDISSKFGNIWVGARPVGLMDDRQGNMRAEGHRADKLVNLVEKNLGGRGQTKPA